MARVLRQPVDESAAAECFCCFANSHSKFNGSKSTGTKYFRPKCQRNSSDNNCRQAANTHRRFRRNSRGDFAQIQCQIERIASGESGRQLEQTSHRANFESSIIPNFLLCQNDFTSALTENLN